MKLGKTFLLSAIANFVRIITGLITTKVMAVQLGPAGVALLGQFSSLHGLLCVLSTCTTSQGLIRLGAEHPVGTPEYRTSISTGFKITVATSAIIGLITLVLSTTLAEHLLHDRAYWPFVALAGTTLLFHGMSVVILTALNGQQDTATYTRVSIVQGLIASAFSIAGALIAELPGVFVGMATSVPFAFLASLAIVRSKPWFSATTFLSPFSSETGKRFIGFATMSIATAVSTPVALLAIRELLIDNSGLDAAGYWQATWRISEIYLGILVTTIGLYLIPRLSKHPNRILHFLELKRVCLLVCILCAAVSTALITGSEWVVKILYSSAFEPMQHLFPLQLAGDFFKAMALVLNTVLIVNSRVGQQVLGEVGAAAAFVFLASILVTTSGVQGVQTAYLGSQFLWAVYLGACAYRTINALPTGNGEAA